MEEAAVEGWRNLWCDPSGVSIEEGRLLIRAAPLLGISERSSAGFQFGDPQAWRLEDLDGVQLRIDPPTDLAYVQTLQLLEYGCATHRGIRTQFTNPIAALLTSTSKLEPLRVPHLSPPTLVSRDWKRLSTFGRTYQRTLLKPLNSFQSAGVQRLDWRTTSDDDHAREAIQSLSNGFCTPVVLQKDLRDSGDEVRAWLLDGSVLGAAFKTFAGDSSDASGLRTGCLSEVQRKTLSTLRRHLRTRGIRLAAVDLIGGLVIDLNFASPGMLVELEELTGENLARRVIRALTYRAMPAGASR